MSAAKFSSTIFAVTSLFAFSSCGDVQSPTFKPKLLELAICETDAGNACPAAPTVECASSREGATTPPTAIIPVGSSRNFCALGRYEVLNETGDEFNVSSDWRLVSNLAAWSSSSSNALSVNDNGIATGVSEALAVSVVASLGEKEVDAPVRVTAPALEEIDISPNGPVETLKGAGLEFVCEGRYSAACDSSGASNCDITSMASFNSDNPSAFSINNDGVGRALTATPDSSPAAVVCMATDPSGVNGTLTSSPAAAVTVCDPVPEDVSLQIVADSPSVSGNTLTLVLNQTPVQLSLIASYTSCLTGQSREQDVSAFATWSSSDNTVAPIDEAGLVSALAEGSAIVSGTFGDFPPATLNIDVVTAVVGSISIAGPEVAVAGLSEELVYQATAIMNSVETGEEVAQIVLANSPDTPFAVWTSDSTDLAFPDSGVGVATLTPSAAAQNVEVSAEYLGVTGTLTTKIVDFSAVGSVEIDPGLACIGDALSVIPLLGEPVINMQSYAIVDYQDEAGADQSCAVQATEASEWANTPAELTSSLLNNLLGGLLSPLNSLLLSCEDGGTLLNAINLGLDESPATVSNEPGTKGQLTGTSGMNLAGGTCVSATLGPNEVTGFSSVLVAANIQAVCELLSLGAASAPSVDSCSPVAADAGE